MTTRLSLRLRHPVAALLVLAFAAPAAAQPVLIDLLSGPPSSTPSYLAVYDNTLYFAAFTNETDENGNSVGEELYRLDGTTAVLAADVGDGYSSEPRDLTVAGGMIFFSAEAGTAARELFAYDLTDGARLVKDINPGVFSSLPRSFAAYDGDDGQVVFFSANDGSVGTELWKSDGTTGGAQLVSDLYFSSNSSFPAGLTPTANGLFFGARDGGSSDDTGYALWETGGTSITLAADLAPNSPHGSVLPLGRAAVGGAPTAIFLQADDNSGIGLELWKYDLSTSTASLVEDINPNGHGASAYTANRPNGTMPVLNGEFFFSGNDGTSGWELWASDGTASGTRRVADINPGTANATPRYFTVYDGKVYFQADDGTNGVELWESDGTAAGTQMIMDINPGSSDSFPTFLTVYDGALYFRADDGANGIELWKLDANPPPPPLELSVSENITVTDEARPMLALLLQVMEDITVTDEVGPTLALLLQITESITVTDTPDIGFAPDAFAELDITDGGYVDFGADVAVDIDFSGLSCTDPAPTASVARFDSGPSSVPGIDEETVADYRWVIEADGCTFEDATEVCYNLAEVPDPDINDPTGVQVYKRPTDQSTPFEAVPTSYDAASDEICASGFTSFSEFVFAGDATVLPVETPSAPEEVVLHAAYPNPFSLRTTIRYELPRQSTVRLTVIDVLGREVAVLVDGTKPAGRYHVVFKASALPSGLYIYRLEAGSHVESRRVVVLK